MPFTLHWDDVPVDISFVFEAERPAGKRGFVRADGGRLVFEDGSEARFWGTELDGAANFPSHAEAEMVAERIAKTGVNMVRAHMLDDGSSTPNIFQFNRAVPKRDTRSLDPESLDRWHYLVARLKERGIYVFLDMLDYRQFLPGDEVDACTSLIRGAKPYTYFDPRLIELQREYNEQLWTHVNPYTGLAPKDDPVFALGELLNESNLFVGEMQAPAPTLFAGFLDPFDVEPHRSRFEARYREWADEHGVDLGAAEPVDFTCPDAAMARFFSEVQSGYIREMIAHLRSIGVKVPIAGENLHWNLGHYESQLAGDFVDNHLYWNHPHWDNVRGTNTTPMVGATTDLFTTASMAFGGPPSAAFHRSLERPYFISEWSHCWPDEWRAEAMIAWSAHAAFQGWAGMTNASYRSGTGRPREDSIGAGAAPHGGGGDFYFFDTFNDPAIYGLVYHAALIFRRGDVRAGDTRAVVEMPDDDGGGWRLRTPADVPGLQLLGEKHVAGMSVPGHRPAADVVVGAEDPFADWETGEIVSDTGELGRNWKVPYGWVDTMRTKAAYGFLARAGPIELDGLALEIETDFATVAVSSLTDDPIADSPSLLLTAVGRCDNTDARYDLDHKWQVDPGHAPVLIEAIEGEVRLRTTQPGMRVLMVGERGEAMRWLPATMRDGRLCFRIGIEPEYSPTAIRLKPRATIHYLIQP